MVRNLYFSRFRIIQNFALRMFIPSFLPSQPLIESLRQRLKRQHCIYNKPELATMRPDCVSACIDPVTYMD